MTTKILSEEEKQNRENDFLSGLEIIDGEFRLFIIEGLNEKGLKEIEEKIPRDFPNDKKTKILKNHNVKFKERMYSQFNLEIKRVFNI